MFLSQYTNTVYIKPDVYAVFNSLLLDPVFMSSDEVNALKQGSFSAFQRKDLNLLKSKCIIIDNPAADKKALHALRAHVKRAYANTITLMYIIPNSTCNLCCDYCFIGSTDSMTPKFMTTSTAKTAITKFIQHLEENELPKGTIVFYGGEPLISFDLIISCVRFIRQTSINKDIEIAIITNGTLLTKEKVQQLKQYSVEIGLSIDGPQNVTDMHRHFKNDCRSVYENVMGKITLLKESEISWGLSVTITNEFLDNSQEYLEWLIENNIKNANFNLLHMSSKADWEKYYRKAVRFLFDVRKKLIEHDIFEDRTNRKYSAFFNRDFRYSDCGAVGANQISIRPNGEVTICHGFWNDPSENHIGNIKEISFNDIINCKNYCSWRDRITINREKCLSCSAIYICGGGCTMESKQMFGSEEALDLPFCYYTKRFLRLILCELYRSTASDNIETKR